MAGIAKNAYLLASPDQRLTVVADEKGLQIKVPAAAPDSIATVVVLEFNGEPRVIESN